MWLQNLTSARVHSAGRSAVTRRCRAVAGQVEKEQHNGKLVSPPKAGYQGF